MEILWAVILVAGIGLLAGLLLAVLSKVMAVPVDEKAEKIEAILPGANCGSCGFSGCSGYAAALSSGATTDTALCNPGGTAVSKEIAEIMGLAAGEITPMTAVVMCKGTPDKARNQMIYQGVESCKMAAQLYGGEKSCHFGCLGLGDCVRQCPYHAIKICDGVAVVNPDICMACKKCVSVCPKGIIDLVPKTHMHATVLCKNHDKGAQTRKDCAVGCIGCTKCVKVCPQGAIAMDNNVAKVDPDKCTGCGECNAACPVKAINLQVFHC